jgi:hypothetical protein
MGNLLGGKRTPEYFFGQLPKIGAVESGSESVVLDLRER